MYPFLNKYYRYVLILFILYLILTLLKNIFNFYSLAIFIIVLLVFYNYNKRLFKKIVYKIIFKNKSNLSFKNKFGAAKNSLEGIEEINKNNIKNIDLISYSYILGGSIGIGIDRISKGYVIDFINLNIINFPIFNIADTSINIGLIILIYSFFKNKR